LDGEPDAGAGPRIKLESSIPVISPRGITKRRAILPKPGVGLNLTKETSIRKRTQSKRSNSTSTTSLSSAELGSSYFPGVITTFEMSPDPSIASGFEQELEDADSPRPLGMGSNSSICPDQSQMQFFPPGGELVMSNLKNQTRRSRGRKSEPKATTTPHRPRARRSTKIELKTEVSLPYPLNSVLFSNAHLQERELETTNTPSYTSQLGNDLEFQVSPSLSIHRLQTPEAANLDLEEWKMNTSKLKANRVISLSQTLQHGEGSAHLSDIPLKSVSIILSNEEEESVMSEPPNVEKEMKLVKPILSLPDLTIMKASEAEDLMDRTSDDADVALIQKVMAGTSLKCAEEAVLQEAEPDFGQNKGERRRSCRTRVKYQERVLQVTPKSSKAVPTPVSKVTKNPNPGYRVVENPGFSWTFLEEELEFVFRV